MVPPRHAVLQKQEAGTTRESVSRLGQRGQRGHAPLRSSLVSMGASQSQRAEDTGPILAQEETPKSQERQASADTVNCPTCQGTGRIPRGQEDKLVAVIPCTDQRLRPRHTKFYVCLSVGVCLLISGLVLFFLFPRSVSLSDLAVNSAYVVFTPAATNITIFNSLNISNDNFATVEASELDVRVFYLETVVGSTKVANVTKVKPRSEKMVSVWCLFFYIFKNILNNNKCDQEWNSLFCSTTLKFLSASLTLGLSKLIKHKHYFLTMGLVRWCKFKDILRVHINK
uniref:Transmembrane protein 106B n=1 Tax=Denticeps clupeoides TaxID=299321 RepID=A0AAY4DDI0_9TELE